MFVIRLMLCLFLGVHFSFAQSLAATGKGIYHRSRPAKKEPVLDVYSNMSDNDIFEQIDVYSATDETSYIHSSCQPNCSSPQISHSVSRKQIEESGARDLLDILKVTMGLDVSKEANGYFKVSYRGLREDARMKLVIDDGQSQDAYNGRNFWQIPADLIERVDIFYGPDSAEFGVSVINGVIKVTSRRQDGISAHVYGGGFSTYAGSLVLGGKLAGGQHYLTVQMEAEEGPRLAVQADRFSHQDIVRDANDMFTHAKRFLFSSTFSSDLVISKKMGMHFLSHGQLFWQQRGPYIGAFDAVGPSSKLSWLFWNMDTRWRVPYAKANVFEVKFYANQNIVDNFFQLTPAPYVVDDQVHEPHVFKYGILSDTKYKILTLGGEIKNIIHLSRDNSLTVSGNIESAGILKDSFSIAMNRNLEGGSQKLMPIGLQLTQNQPCDLYGFTSGLYGACRMTFSVAMLDEWQIEKPLQLFAGFRLFSFSDVKFDLWSHLNPKLGAIIIPGRNWMLKVIFQQGIRVPTFKELYDQTPQTFSNISPGQFLGNSQLKPELAKAAVLNLSYTETYQNIQYFLETSGHFSRVSNAIEKIDIKSDQNNLSNNGRYSVFGAEANTKALFPGGSYAFFNISWYRSYWQELDAAGSQSCQTGLLWNGDLKNKCSLITNLPQLRVNTGMNLMLGHLGSLYMAAELGSQRRNNVRSDLEKQRSFHIDPYTLFNISFRSQPFFNYFVLHGSIFNLFNFYTQDDVARPDNLPGLVPREGTTFYLGLSVII